MGNNNAYRCVPCVLCTCAESQHFDWSFSWNFSWKSWPPERLFLPDAQSTKAESIRSTDLVACDSNILLLEFFPFFFSLSYLFIENTTNGFRHRQALGKRILVSFKCIVFLVHFSP